MVGSCDSIKRGNFSSIFLINRHKLAPKLGLMDLIRVEFGEVVVSAEKLLFDVQCQIALEISLHPWGRGRLNCLANCYLASSRGSQLLYSK